MSDSRGGTFRMSFRSIMDRAIVFGVGSALLGGLLASAIQGQPLGDGDPFLLGLWSIVIGLAFVCGIAVVAPSVALVVWLCPIEADDSGVRGLGAFGAPREAAWTVMNSARAVNLLGLPGLRVTFGDSEQRMWIPLFLSDRAAFVSHVVEVAPAGNIVRAHFEQNAD